MAVKRYDGSAWQTVAGLGAQGPAATSSSIATWVKTASGGETSVSGNDDNSQPLSYTVGQELVFINGVLQKRGDDYTATTGNSITGLTALTAGDIVSVWTVNAFSVTNAISNTIMDAKGDLLTASSADVPAKLTVGNNGETLVADSSTSTGLRWQGNYAAGKNFVNNGNMNISQRGTSSAGLATGENPLIDRFVFRNNNLGTATYSQDTDAPTGFKTSAKILWTTADATPAASDFAFFRHKMEGQSLQSLNKGSASAKPTTLSFWVKSNVTGTYVVDFSDSDNSRIICGTYTINSSGTWEKKTITIAGDTTGALDNDNASSFLLDFGLGSGTDRTSGTLQTTWGATVTANILVGQVNVAATVNNYWMITGIQWEIGSVATEWCLSSGTLAGELAACQRYYYRHIDGTNQAIGVGANYSSGEIDIFIQFPVTMRGTPSLVIASGTDYYRAYFGVSTDTFDNFVINLAHSRGTFIYSTTGTAVSSGMPSYVLSNNASASIAFNAEL